MSIKIEAIKGAPKGSYGSTRPVMVCDGPKCDSKLAGNQGQDGHSLRERAYSLGWQAQPNKSLDFCPDCDAAMDAKPNKG